MPREIAAPKKAPVGKKPPLGIPKWGWVAAIGAGLLIGYLVLKKSNSSSSSDQSSGTETSPLGQSSGTGAGAVASPAPTNNPILQTLTDPGKTNGGGGSGGSGGSGGAIGSEQPQPIALQQGALDQIHQNLVPPKPTYNPSINPFSNPTPKPTYNPSINPFASPTPTPPPKQPIHPGLQM